MAISNTVQNPFQTPASKYSAGFGKGLVSTLQKNQAKNPWSPATANTFNTTPQPKTSGLMNLPKPQIVDSIKPQTTSNQTSVSRATEQPLALGGTQSQKMYTPSGIEITGNPATFSGGQQSQQTPTQPSQPFSTPVRGLFPDIVSSLARRSLEPSQAFTRAQEDYQKANTELGRYQAEIADKLALEEQRAIPLEFVQGRQQVLARQAEQGLAARESALSRAATQQQTALQQQGLEQQALSTAAGFAPEAMRFDAFDGGGNLAPQTRAAELAQQVRSGLIDPSKAEAMMNSLYGGAGATFLNQALQGGYNYNVGAAQAAAQQSNIQQAGTAQTDIARQGLQDATMNYGQLTTALNTATQQANVVKDILGKTGLNNAASTDFNKALNEVSRRFSSQDFTALDVALRELQNFYGRILSTGGNTPTFNDQQAMSVLDISKSARAITEAIAQLENAAFNLQSSQYSLMQQYQGALQGGGAQGGNSYTSSSGKTYNLPY